MDPSSTSSGYPASPVPSSGGQAKCHACVSSTGHPQGARTRSPSPSKQHKEVSRAVAAFAGFPGHPNRMMNGARQKPCRCGSTATAKQEAKCEECAMAGRSPSKGRWVVVPGARAARPRVPEAVPCPVRGCGRCTVQADAGGRGGAPLVQKMSATVEAAGGAGEEAAGGKGRARGGAKEA